MRKFVAMIVGALALFAFSALAAPDMGKVKFGVYAPSGTVAYAVPGAAPPTLAVNATTLTVNSEQNIQTGAVGAGAMPSTLHPPVSMISTIGPLRSSWQGSSNFSP